MNVGKSRIPEVGELGGRAAGRLVRRHDHVLRLDVAMHHAALVRVLESVGEHRTDRQQGAIGDPAAAIERSE